MRPQKRTYQRAASLAGRLGKFPFWSGQYNLDDFLTSVYGFAALDAADATHARYAVLQPIFNLMDRKPYEGELEDLCTREGIGVFPYYGLASGFLTGKYRSEADYSKSVRGGGMKRYLNEKGLKVLAAMLEGADAKTLRDTMDKLKDKLKTAAIVLAVVDGGKVQLAAGVTADSMGKVKAGELVNFVAQQVGGKGGGKPDMAMAGGTDPSRLGEARFDHVIIAIWEVFADSDGTIASAAAAILGIVVSAALYRNAKVNKFSFEVAEELARVKWPTREETWNQTMIVLVVSVVAAIILGVFDATWSKLSDLVYQI